MQKTNVSRVARTLAVTAALLVVAGIATVIPAPVHAAFAQHTDLLNVSYDPTRELFKALNFSYTAKYTQDTGNELSIKQSHGGSGAQARAVVDGLQADVVSLALWPDIDAIRKAGLIANKWEERLPNNSVPWTSTLVFMVRKGNPKGIRDWPDLIKSGVEIITPNPKTSGNGKLSFLAAWGSVTQRGGSEPDALAFVTQLYQQTPVLDQGARGATITFAQKDIGDVQITWENEAHLELVEFPDQLEIVYPPISFLAEPPVAWVDTNVRLHGTKDAAEGYLKFFYTDEGQEIIARNFYRPINDAVRAKHASTFPPLQMFPVTAVAKDWADAYARFFSEGGVFDQIFLKK